LTGVCVQRHPQLWLAALGVAVFGALASSSAAAAPQANIGLLPGLCARARTANSEACFSGALHADVMFGRERANSLGYGPWMQVGTAGFEDLRLYAGGAVQLPVAPVQLVLSGAPYHRIGEVSEPGLGARLFVGSRSYNYGGSYIAVFGLTGGIDWGFGDLKERNVLVAAHLDGMWLAIPVMVLVSWIRGPSD
jgi:hypothetical protein